MPFFSIVIPLYNKAAYIRKAVASVVAQSFSDWELIVVDDGSDDNGMQVVETFSDSRIRLLRQSNAGVSAARNNGVAIAKGDYICFLDADDWWDTHHLESLHGLIARHPHAGLYATTYTIVKNGKQRTAPIGIDSHFSEGAIDYCSVYAKTLCMPVYASTACMPHSLFDLMGGFRHALTLGEDFDLWLRIEEQYPIVLLNRTDVYYNQDSDPKYRAISRLHAPEHHVIWNLQAMEHRESEDSAYKQLIDALRVYDLYPYYLCRRYREAARQQLAKVDWQHQPKKWRLRYWVSGFRSQGSRV